MGILDELEKGNHSPECLNCGIEIEVFDEVYFKDEFIDPSEGEQEIICNNCLHKMVLKTEIKYRFTLEEEEED